ncbi:MAG TPA: flagellin FliC, partial [Achromobacter sp.]|nr:flagellin FliC [Achromobacter sp.]
RNANDGISIAQTTEGALNEVNNNLQRIRQLSVQATNGTNSQTDLDSIQAEISQRLGEITRVSEQTQFNGVKVLAKDNTLTIQVGANDNETITINLEKIDANSLGLEKLSINGPQGATDTVAASDVAAFLNNPGATGAVPTTGAITGATELGSTPPDSGTLVKDSKGNLFLEVASTAGATKKGATTVGDKTYVAVKASDLSVDATSGDITIASKDASKTTFAATTDPLANIDKALSQVDNLRSDLGAIQNRFESTVANLNNTINNLSAARSRIEDADYATEVSNMTKAQILQQAGTSVLAQANQVPQTVLSLLR